MFIFENICLDFENTTQKVFNSIIIPNLDKNFKSQVSIMHIWFYEFFLIILRGTLWEIMVIQPWP